MTQEDSYHHSTLHTSTTQMLVTLPSVSKRKLRLQRTICHFTVIMTYGLVWLWMKFLMGYRIRNLKEFRHEMKRLRQESTEPFLICANHLTMIDSLILLWGLGSPIHYLRHFQDFPWNTPEKENFSKLLLYFGKCLPIIRKGPRSQTKKAFGKIVYLLSLGDHFMIFPEGTRSRSGRVNPETATSGVGRLVMYYPKMRTICIYLRGDQQSAYSFYPVRRERFTIAVEEIKPQSSQPGMKGARDISYQIVAKLKDMEDRYLAQRQEPAPP